MPSKLKEPRLDNLFSELGLIKQELIQAENKIGWAAAFFTIVISVLVAIDLHTRMWGIIAPLVACPVLSLLTLVTALVPSIKLLPSPKIYQHDRLNIMKISFYGYKQVYKNTNTEKSLTASINLFSQLAFRKYKLIKVAFGITFFGILILQKWCRIMTKQGPKHKLSN